MGTILLVRHGLASFGLGDYDRLTETGRDQARALGAALRERGVAPSLVVHGELRRQRETADALLEAAGQAPERRVDPRWDEFDHRELLTVLRPRYRSPAVLGAEMAATGRPLDVFRETLERALERWSSGEHDDQYVETFAGFTARARGALERVAANAPRGTTVVVSSAGTIAAVCAGLLGTPTSGWLALNRVYANTGVTRIVSGRRGLSLVSFNEQAHLPERTAR